MVRDFDWRIRAFCHFFLALWHSFVVIHSKPLDTRIGEKIGGDLFFIYLAVSSLDLVFHFAVDCVGVDAMMAVLLDHQGDR